MAGDKEKIYFPGSGSGVAAKCARRKHATSSRKTQGRERPLERLPGPSPAPRPREVAGSPPSHLAAHRGHRCPFSLFLLLPGAYGNRFHLVLPAVGQSSTYVPENSPTNTQAPTATSAFSLGGAAHPAGMTAGAGRAASPGSAPPAAAGRCREAGNPGKRSRDAEMASRLCGVAGKGRLCVCRVMPAATRL